MNDAKENEQERLGNLNNTLAGVENKLLHRALDRSRSEVENAYDFINQAADAGIVDIACDDCEPAPEAPGGETPPEEPAVPETMPHMGASVPPPGETE